MILRAQLSGHNFIPSCFMGGSAVASWKEHDCLSSRGSKPDSAWVLWLKTKLFNCKNKSYLKALSLFESDHPKNETNAEKPVKQTFVISAYKNWLIDFLALATVPLFRFASKWNPTVCWMIVGGGLKMAKATLCPTVIMTEGKVILMAEILAKDFNSTRSWFGDDSALL